MILSNVFHVRALYYTKNIDHQQMHKDFFFNCNTLLQVSTLLGHLQGEFSVVITLRLNFIVELLTTESSRLQKQGSTQSTAQIISATSVQRQQKILPEDDPAGSKHVGVWYNWRKNSLCICGWLIFFVHDTVLNGQAINIFNAISISKF
jgi:hypothetical protein